MEWYLSDEADEVLGGLEGSWAFPKDCVSRFPQLVLLVPGS